MGAIHTLAAADLVGGGYVNIFKIIPAILLLLLWAKLLAWADKDAVVAHLPRIPLNTGMLGSMVAAYFFFFLLPYYFVTLPMLFVVFGANVGAYAAIRRKQVGLDDLKGQFNEWLHSFGKKKEIKAVAGQVLLVTKNGQTIEPPTGDAPDRPAYDAAQLVLTDALKKGAEQIDVDSRTESGTLKYVVDCFTYTGPAVDRATSATAIGYLKAIAGMDIEERRKPQTGNMRLTMDGKKHDVRVQTAGSTAGEMMRLELDPKKKHEFQLTELGFTEPQTAMVKQSIAENTGIVILSAPKSMGLTSLMYGMLRGHDAFLQHIQTVERDAQQDLDGVTQNKLPANAPAAEEFKTTDWVISQEPNVILINQIEDPRSATELIKFSKSEGGRRVYVGIRGISTFEALEHWRKLVGDDSLALESLKLVINGRVLRKLCMACKVEFAPEPGMVRKLGMNPEKVTKLFQARTQPLRDQKGNPIVCEFCQDLRYKGRQGVYEIMVIDDEMRQAIIAGKPVEPVFRRQRARFLQDEALALVEAGETSVQEVKRVMKGGTGEAEPPAQAAAAAPAPKAAAGRAAKPAGARPAGTSPRAATPKR
jgi:type II secretory ATPase GspE/PulE/Tfp pilus assembly ATPase PilB-like protein